MLNNCFHLIRKCIANVHNCRVFAIAFATAGAGQCRAHIAAQCSDVVCHELHEGRDTLVGVVGWQAQKLSR